jgi:ubiquinone/menaquinone biosynthesis C-methylase UbiE
MDARLVWNTWRRILSNDQLVQQVLHPSALTTAKTADLSAAEMAVLAEYAKTPDATNTNIGMYRRGLVRNALAALNLVPLTRHLLYSTGLDIEAVAADFVRSTGYMDYGPHVWKNAARFVTHLEMLPEFATGARKDVLGLDAATVALARRLGESAVDVWPEDAVAAFSTAKLHLENEAARFVASRAAIVASSSHDLTTWVENPEDFSADEELEPVTRHWLVYFPTADARPEYASLSERAARAFSLLSAPKTLAEVSLALSGLSDAALLKVIGGLAALGVVIDGDCPKSRMKSAELRSHVVANASSTSDHPSSMLTLPSDACVLLDPAVELLDVEIAEHRLLCHSLFEVGMVVPPGEGLLNFVITLMGKPISLGVLRKSFGDQIILHKMLAALHSHGFLHLTSQNMPSTEELAQLRNIAVQMREKTLRRLIVIDLDVATMPTEHLCAEVNTGATASDVLFHCAQLREHKATLAELARLRQDGKVRLHRTVVQTTDLTCDADVCESLIRLGASVLIEGVPWPAPDYCISGLAEMTRHRVAVHAYVTPDLSILDESVREHFLAWARSVFFSGLCLRLEADTLWPAADATEKTFIAIFNAVRALEKEFGDVQILNLPSDEVLLGNLECSSRPAQLSDFANRFRTSYLRWRLPFLKLCEADNTFSQTPEAEEKLVRAQDDLLPNHPELLLLQPGSIVVDVCGGMGRVARRLAPIVGQDGLIISIEMLRCVSDRACYFACKKNMTNLHFRPGLAQRIPLPDRSVDAAVNEWSGGIWELGLGRAMVKEMARVVRTGGRIAVTHRLVRIPLARLGQPWVQFDNIYEWMCNAFAHPELTIITERVWGQIAPSLVGENATEWRKQYLCPIINPFDVIYEYESDPGPHVDVCLTMVAERR